MTSLLPSGRSAAPASTAPRGRGRRRGRAPEAASEVFRLASACALAGLLGLPDLASGITWTNVNPGGGGAFTCAGSGPTGVILIGSDIGGLYRSDDQGTSWKNVGWLNGNIERCYIASLAFDPQNPWVVHLGTEGGLYRSQDGGNTFDLKYNDGFWASIAVAPSDPDVVYTARMSDHTTVDPAIFRSLNGGVFWSPVGSLPFGTHVIRLRVKPDDPMKLLAVSGWEKLMGSAQPLRGLFVSSDGGVTWTDVHGDSTSGGMTGNPWDAAYDPVHPDTIFATTVVGSGNPDVASTWSGYTWRGTHGSGAWTQVSAHTGAIVLGQGTGEVVTADVRRDGPGCSECGTWSSVNSGQSWTRKSTMAGWDAGWNGSIAWAYNTAFSGIAKTLHTDLSDADAIYWITPQFVWRSADFGASFTNVFTNAAAPGFWSGRGINNVAPASISVVDTVVYAGYYDLGIWRSLDSGESWQASNDPGLSGTWNGRGGNCMTILADPDRPHVVWASQGGSMTLSMLLRSDASATPGSWSITTGLPLGFVSGLALDPASPVMGRTMYVSSNGDVFKSVDDGWTWNLSLDCDSCYVTAASGPLVFSGGQKGLWRSQDGGANWTEISPGIFHLGPSGYSGITGAKWRGPHDIRFWGSEVHVAVNGPGRGLYRSVDGGDSWTLLRPDEYARRIHIDSYGSMYLGSSSATNAGGSGASGSTGIQISRDSGVTWSSLTHGLPYPFVWQIDTMDRPDGTVRLFVGSPGSGYWTGITAGGVPLAVGDGRSPALRLSGFQPNPARERIAVSFSLPTAEPATLEVFDIAGRRVLRRDVGGMGPGSHVLPLGTGFRPAPGIYAVRLVQGAGRPGLCPSS